MSGVRKEKEASRMTQGWKQEEQVWAGGYGALTWGPVEFETTSRWSCGNPKKADEGLSLSSERNQAEDIKHKCGSYRRQVNGGKSIQVSCVAERRELWAFF